MKSKWIILGFSLGIIFCSLIVLFSIDHVVNARTNKTVAELGVSDARRDIESGTPRYHVPAYSPNSYRETMKSELRRCGVLPIFYGDVLLHGESEFFDSYNYTVREFLKAKHGEDIIKLIEKEARE